MYGWFPLLFTCNYDNIVNWLYPNTKWFLHLKINFLKKEKIILSGSLTIDFAVEVLLNIHDNEITMGFALRGISTKEISHILNLQLSAFLLPVDAQAGFPTPS